MSVADSIIGPEIAMMWFGAMTTVHAGLQYMYCEPTYDDSKGSVSNTKSYICFIIYILSIIAGEYFINLGITASVCGGSPQWGTSILVTTVPWVIIFGSLNLMLTLFPGWKIPFSNTIGYGITRFLGITGFIRSILTSSSENGNNNLEKPLGEIYTDPSPFVNEMPLDIDNFSATWVRLVDGKVIGTPGSIWGDQNKELRGNIIRKGVTDVSNGDFTKKNMIPFILNYSSNSELLKENKENSEYMIGAPSILFNYVRLKSVISEFIWYMLTGALITSVGYNYILNTGCSIPAAEMERRHQEYIEKETVLAKERENKQERVYTSHE